MLAGSKTLCAEGEIIRRNRKPSYADLIEIKRPLWASHGALLKLGLGLLCLLKIPIASFYYIKNQA